MARTKKSKPGGGKKNAQDKPATKKGTRSQAQKAKISTERSTATKQDEAMDDVIVLNSDSKPEQATESSAKKQRQEKGAQSVPKQGSDPTKDSALVSALELAFNQKRALMISVDSGQGSEAEAAAKEAVSSAIFRNKLYKAIIDSPLTSSAWVSLSTRKVLRTWFVLCIFPDKNEARIAYDGLDGKLSLAEFPHIRVRCSLYPFKAAWNIAKMTDPNKALPPRGPQTVPKPDPAVPLANAPRDPAVAASTEVNKSASTTLQFKLPKNPQTSQATSSVVPNPLAVNFQQPPAEIEVPITKPSVSRQVTVPKQDRAKKPTSSSKIQQKNRTTIDAMNLSEMEYSEQVKYQCRYIGEVDPGVPIFGCILCLRRDHLWDDCPDRTCEHCGEKDKHISRACPKVKKCSKCLEKGHTVEECTSKLKRTAEDGFHCDRCGEDTHSEEDCSYIWRSLIPEKESNIKKVPKLCVFCYNCGREGHWGGDCKQLREKPKSHYDTFSAKEAAKYIDPFAPLSNLLSDVAEIQIKGKANDAGLSIRGAGSTYPASVGSDQQIIQPPLNPNNARARREFVQQKAPFYDPPSTYQQTYSDTHNITLPARQSNRGNDGYVRYQGNQSQPSSSSRSNPPSRQRSRSPPSHPDANYRHRTDGYSSSNLALSHGWYDDRGAFHYERPDRQYEARAPPPPPPPPKDGDYGRRQTYHAVPPPPPETNHSRRQGGGYDDQSRGLSLGRYATHR